MRAQFRAASYGALDQESHVGPGNQVPRMPKPVMAGKPTMLTVGLIAIDRFWRSVGKRMEIKKRRY
jgi:hypothetical protein